MAPDEVKQAFAVIGPNISAISRLLQTGRSSLYRWLDEGTDGCNAILLRLVRAGKITADDIEAAAERKPDSP
jgi:hypothetical protein